MIWFSYIYGFVFYHDFNSFNLDNYYFRFFFFFDFFEFSEKIVYYYCSIITTWYPHFPY